MALSRIEQFPNGWFRCGIGIRTTSNLSYTASIYPASADNTDSANADSIYAWGAQFEFGGALGISTYIPTTVSTVQRNSDSLITSISVGTDKWFNPAAGALYFEWLNLAADNFSGIVPGGIGDTFANVIYISKSSTTLNATFGRNSVGLTRSFTASHSYLQRVKAACTWTSTNVAFCVSGNSTNLSSSTTSYVPASTQRFGIGYSPWGATPPASAISAHGYGIFRVAAYYSHRLSNSELESLTAA